ncbi:MAG: monofunctional biosynthetic peptidoglycan transglycosylase [Melioribacteraceae bacterium]|nr:monofunctional biosynthetic peptidoglycan transglycosylase [Melioribacteraceae bacterium]
MKLTATILKRFSLFVLIFSMMNLFLIIFFRFIDPASTAFIYQNSEDIINSLFSSSDVRYKPISISKVSYYLPLAVIASEDQKFFEHFGFDFEQIEKAMKENEYRKRKRGASTITMQVAKNLFLWSERNFIRKGFEAYYSLLLEILWSKSRIIETYLNIAEMGNGIYGVNSASKIFFKKNPLKISISEAAAIAAVLPNPKKRNPIKPSRYLIARRGEIIKQMNLIGGKNYIKQNLN